MQLSFFSDSDNIISLIIFLFALLFCLFIITRKLLEGMEKAFIVGIIFSFTFMSGYQAYLDNFVKYSDLYYNIKTISNLNININTFKEHEHRLPKEKDFYLSGFLNDSEYFQIEDNKKIFNPISNSDFIIKDNFDSLSFIYTKNYDKTSFIKTGQAYRYCLNFSSKLNESSNFKNIKISINGKDFDYKKATKESMKDICYSDKPNSFTLTFF